MSSGFHDPLVRSKITLPSERSTGFVFAMFALIVAIIFRWSTPILIAGIVAATVFALLSLAAPSLLRPLNQAWFRLSLLLHRIVNPVVMLLIFAVVFIPMGYLMRIWRDPLVGRRRPDLPSYWVGRDPSEGSSSMRNQF